MKPDYFMQRAIHLALKGWPLVAPNPLVGCLIVHKDKIVAEGYHEKYGMAHAEVNAIHNLPDNILPSECELFVTLEPCSHFGKTPPCADLIISKGFKKVIIACKDPNPLVAGEGIKKLKQAGIEVTIGVLEQEARQLNKRFITFFEKKRPYIFLKWAQTADGFISRIPLPAKREDNLISGPEAQTFVHHLRAEVMGIFTGKNTVLNDNPSLTTRLVEGKNPIRIFIDKNLEVPSFFNVYNSESETLVFNAVKDAVEGHIHYVKLEFTDSVLPKILEKLRNRNVQSLLVEGGSTLLTDFIKQGLWDEILVFENPELEFKQGLLGPAIRFPSEFERVGKDKLYRLLKS